EPALGHSVRGVDRQIHHYLLELARIDANERRVRRQPRLDLNVAEHETAHELLDAAQHVVGIDDARLERLPAAEREELPGELRRTRRRAANLLDLPLALLHARIEQNQLGVAADDREQIVEVVRDAAREPADGFHLLRLEELLLQPLELGEVRD